MEKMDSRRLPEAALNERRRRAVKLRLAGVSIRETAIQCELSTNTVMRSHRAYEQGGWAAVKVKCRDPFNEENDTCMKSIG